MSIRETLSRRFAGADHHEELRSELATLRAEVAELHQAVMHLNHLVGQLNHDVRAGSSDVLPLFLGYAERFRADADAMVGASEVIERQLRWMQLRIAELDGHPATSS